ncbi:MAG: alpha/beta hydrolase [Tenuifilaceae bacterium]|nr:alpha/beta hydrolase [Tenuifilaceae bacterium]
MKRLIQVAALLLCFGAAYTTNAQSDGDKAYRSSEVAIFNGRDTLRGTLLLPDGKEKPAVVLIIAGSGPTDRNGNQFGMTNNSLKFLAEELATNGIASLRYDKRGVGFSRSNQPESELIFDDFINDAAIWLTMLKESGNYSKICVAGHSEGSLIGMVAAQNVGVDGFISIAGSGKRIDKILLEQLSQIPEPMLNDAKIIIDSLATGQQVKRINPMLLSLFRPSVQPYLTSWMRLDPTVELGKLTIPILIAQGTTDIQVSTENAELLAKANPLAQLVVVEGMNHVLKMVEMEREKNMAAYINPDLPISEELISAIVEFVGE